MLALAAARAEPLLVMCPIHREKGLGFRVTIHATGASPEDDLALTSGRHAIVLPATTIYISKSINLRKGDHGAAGHASPLGKPPLKDRTAVRTKPMPIPIYVIDAQ